MKSIILTSVAAFFSKVAYGVLTFNSEVAYPINQCIQLDDSGDSMIYRCSNDSIWGYKYTDTTGCTGVPSSISTYAGCDQGSNNVYLIERCAIAQQQAATGNCNYYADTSNVYSIGVCVNYNTANSYQYSCLSGTNIVQRFQWNGYSDCPSTQTPSITNFTTSTYTCGANDCHASAMLYTKSSNDYCDYEASNYGPPDGATYTESDCNYFVFSDGQQPQGTGICISSMDGFYKYSTKYECYDTTGNGNYMIQVWQWLDNDECSGDAYKYLVGNLTSANYTIHCGHNDCGNIIRTYTNCETDLNTHRPTYDESTIVFNQCLQYYRDPNTVISRSYNEYQYYMYACIDGYKGIYYYLDSECNDMDTFVVFNTSEDDCPTIVNGCSAGYRNINPMFGIIVSSIILVVKLLW